MLTFESFDHDGAPDLPAWRSLVQDGSIQVIVHPGSALIEVICPHGDVTLPDGGLEDLDFLAHCAERVGFHTNGALELLCTEKQPAGPLALFCETPAFSWPRFGGRWSTARRVIGAGRQGGSVHDSMCWRALKHMGYTEFLLLYLSPTSPFVWDHCPPPQLSDYQQFFALPAALAHFSKKNGEILRLTRRMLTLAGPTTPE